jgi:hypothetical protein
MSKGWYVKVETNLIFRVDTNIGVLASSSEQAMEEASEIIRKQIDHAGVDASPIPWDFTIGDMEWRRSDEPYVDEDYIKPIHAEPDSDFDPEETSKRDLMDAAMCLLDVFWNLPKDDLRKSDFLPNHGIAVVRDRMAVAANLCYQTWSVMVQRDELPFDGGDFDWDFCPRFFENCMDDQMVLKSGEVHELIKMWKGEKNELHSCYQSADK